MKLIKIQQSSATAGYLITSAVGVMAFTLAFRDYSFLVFAIPIILVFALGASIDKGGVDEDLEAVGWSEKNIKLAVPIGILSGIVSLFIGSLIMQFTPENIGSIIPDMSSWVGKLATASVIPPALAVGANIIGQWWIISPSEESLSKILGSYAGMSVFKNIYIAYVFGIFVWIAMHIPTFIIQGTSIAMYGVLVVLGGTTLIAYFMTRNLISAVVGHGVFNTGVILLSENINIVSYYVILIIAVIIAVVWMRGK